MLSRFIISSDKHKLKERVLKLVQVSVCLSGDISISVNISAKLCKKVWPKFWWKKYDYCYCNNFYYYWTSRDCLRDSVHRLFSSRRPASCFLLCCFLLLPRNGDKSNGPLTIYDKIPFLGLLIIIIKWDWVWQSGLRSECKQNFSSYLLVKFCICLSVTFDLIKHNKQASVVTMPECESWPNTRLPSALLFRITARTRAAEEK